MGFYVIIGTHVNEFSQRMNNMNADQCRVKKKINSDKKWTSVELVFIYPSTACNLVSKIRSALSVCGV